VQTGRDVIKNSRIQVTRKPHNSHVTAELGSLISLKAAMEHSLNQRKSVTTNGTRYRISKPRDCSHHGHTEILV